MESESGSDDEPGSESGSEPIPSVPNPESERISSKHAHLETTSGMYGRVLIVGIWACWILVGNSTLLL